MTSHDNLFLSLAADAADAADFCNDGSRARVRPSYGKRAASAASAAGPCGVGR